MARFFVWHIWSFAMSVKERQVVLASSICVTEPAATIHSTHREPKMVSEARKAEAVCPSDTRSSELRSELSWRRRECSHHFYNRGLDQVSKGSRNVVMRTIAAEKHLRVLSNIYGDWPARRLRMKRAFGYSEVTVSLNPNYTQDEEVFYLLTRREVRSFLGLFQRLVHYREIARYSTSEN